MRFDRQEPRTWSSQTAELREDLQQQLLEIRQEAWPRVELSLTRGDALCAAPPGWSALALGLVCCRNPRPYLLTRCTTSVGSWKLLAMRLAWSCEVVTNDSTSVTLTRASKEVDNPCLSYTFGIVDPLILV